MVSKDSQFGKASASVTKTRSGYQLPEKKQAQARAADGAASHKTKQAAPALKRLKGQSQVSNPDFWVFDAFVTFNRDLDSDGYYSTFTVEFDADTKFAQANVYARLYLSRSNVFEEYHTTSVFTIEGDSSNDGLTVESELLTGFPSADYELLIELYDALDNQLVATFDGTNDADLTFLSLESQTHEQETSRVTVTRVSGGSIGLLLSLMLPVLLIRRKP